MNKHQRKQLADIVSNLQDLVNDEVLKEKTVEEVKDILSTAEDDTNSIAGEEREKFDNIPEGLQAGERGQAIEEAADTLENIFWPDADDLKIEDEESRNSFSEEVQTVIDEIEQVS